MSAGAARVVIGALLLFVPSMPAPAASKADISAIAECRRLRTMVKVAGESTPGIIAGSRHSAEVRGLIITETRPRPNRLDHAPTAAHGRRSRLDTPGSWLPSLSAQPAAHGARLAARLDTGVPTTRAPRAVTRFAR